MLDGMHKQTQKNSPNVSTESTLKRVQINQTVLGLSGETPAATVYCNTPHFYFFVFHSLH